MNLAYLFLYLYLYISLYISLFKVLWAEAIDPDTGKTYYYHIETKETSWEIPPG